MLGNAIEDDPLSDVLAAVKAGLGTGAMYSETNTSVGLCLAFYPNRSFTVLVRGVRNLIIFAFQNSLRLFIEFLRMGIKFL